VLPAAMERNFSYRLFGAVESSHPMISATQSLLGLASGMLVGFSLGLVGGGSILAVPLMIYVVGADAGDGDVDHERGQLVAGRGDGLRPYHRAELRLVGPRFLGACRPVYRGWRRRRPRRHARGAASVGTARRSQYGVCRCHYRGGTLYVGA